VKYFFDLNHISASKVCQKVNFSTLLAQREEEFNGWYVAAISHLCTEDVRPESDKFKAKMIARQWIRIPLAEVKNLSIPTKITPLQGGKESFQS
jgi:hypothetical protein